MTLVAISGAYGAGGSRIARLLAERLGVPFVDRAIPAAVAEALAVPLGDAAAHDEQSAVSWLERMLTGFRGFDTSAPAPPLPERVTAEDFRRATEEVLRRQARTGEGVILGRGGVFVLRDHPLVLRARLTGPPERRTEQAAQLEQIDLESAERRRRQLDRAHDAYAKRFYDGDLDDVSLYHVVIDSTAIPIEASAALLERASRALESSVGAPTRR